MFQSIRLRVGFSSPERSPKYFGASLALSILFLAFAGGHTNAQVSFDLIAPEVTLGVPPGEQTVDFTVSVLLHETSRIATTGVCLLELSLANEPGTLEPLSVIPADTLDSGLGEPWIWIADIGPEGWSFAAIIPGHGFCGTSDPIFPTIDEIVHVTYRADTSAIAAGATSIVTPLTWDTSVGDPQVENRVWEGGWIVPTLMDGSIELISEAPYKRSDCNQDGFVDLADDIRLLMYLFAGGEALDCEAACDHNGDGTLNIADAIYLEGYLFLGGPPPPAPFVECGSTPPAANIELECASFTCG